MIQNELNHFIISYRLPLLLLFLFILGIKVITETKNKSYLLILGWFGYDNRNCFFRYDAGVPEAEYRDALYKIQWYDIPSNYDLTDRAFYTSWMVASILWCAIVTALFWFTLQRKNQQKNRNINGAGTTSSTTNGTRSVEAKETTSGKGSEASSKIQQHSQMLIQKAVIRIAWYDYM